MIYIIRAKAVSECLGIRRANITYFLKKNGIIDLSVLESPLKYFKGIEIKGDDAIVLDEKHKMTIGEDVFFYKNNTVMTSNGKKIERNALGIMVLPLDKEMESFYTKAIEDGYIFDQWNGEFEYLLGLMYEFSESNIVQANEWYDKAESKKFIYKMIRS